MTATNATTTALAVTGGLSLTNNRIYAGTSSPSNSFIFSKGSISGTASPASNGIASPFNLFVSGDSVDTNGTGSLIGFSIEHAVSANHTGGREASQSYLAIVGSPSVAAGGAGYVGGAALTRVSANLGGTSGAYTTYKGSTFAANANIYLTSGATFLNLVNGEEFDITVPAGDSTADKYGISVVHGINDAVRGTYDDSAISINDQDGASAGWHYGISFGSYAHQWAFQNDSTLIGAQIRQVGPSSPSVALNGVDFRNVTFGGYAFASKGFAVDPSGNIFGNNLYASSTNFMTFAGIGSGAGIIANATSTDVTSSPNATAFGYQALGNASSTSGLGSTAFGYKALLGSTNVANSGLNTAIGYRVLTIDSTGAANTGVGANVMLANTTGSSNVGVGQSALLANNSGSSNIAVGQSSLVANTSSSNNIAIGQGSLRGLTGSGAGNNIGLGFNVASTSTSGINNIAIGYDIALPKLTGSNQLDIGNLIFGTGINGEGTSVSNGSIAIGTSTPYSRLTVWGPDSAASTSAFLVANNASTTEFAVLDNGNATLAGNLIQNSDQRLKSDVQTLEPLTALASIRALKPVSYSWIDPDKGVNPQYGFIAQDVQKIFPNLVSETAATPLTPDGTLSLNYNGFIAPLVAAVQGLINRISDFADHFTTKELTFSRATGEEIDVERLCIGTTCVTEDQLKALLNQGDQQTAAAASSGTDVPSIVPEVSTSSDTSI